jgi:hypothetical protein
MAKKIQIVPFDCPCEKKLSLFKSFKMEDGTPPEEVITECPDCVQKIKLQLDNQLSRDEHVYRSKRG